MLFRIGLESNLHDLLSKLPRAAPIWIGNVALSGLPAYLISIYLLDLATIPSLFVAVALTATSVAVSAEVWREANALNSPNGDIFVDVAELDDLSGVALMALLIAVAPAILAGNNSAGLPALMTTGLAGATLIGISMVPRAEIAMVIAQQGRDLGDWAMPALAYSSLAMISVVTCLIAPLGIRWIIRKFPQSLE